MIPRILIIAGSDSGGGAGIQADIKTVTMLGGHAMTAITALTAQNTLGVTSVLPVPAEMVLAQIDAVVSDIGVDAVKIGMIGSPETAHAVAERLESLCSSSRRRPGSPVRKMQESERDPGLRRGDGDGRVPIVFDPVMVATSGAILADAATIAAFERLMTVATLVTPNTAELNALTALPTGTIAEVEAAARHLARRHDVAVLAKGGHLTGACLTDLLIEPAGIVQRWKDDRLDTPHTHGTGCTLASAVAAGLAGVLDLPAAVERGRAYTRAAIVAAPGLGAGHGPLGHALGRVPFDELPTRSS